ncbi:hypothetical protein NEIELOOT_00958 [Neisseria elongata subsp. glycolytica ATCC 29315]|uniref:Uncharacterized protein n=1 Tax=Neisseria elongata subsp. glycolytica ATCC 29315 TaxID=546263 RepID=D4DPH1_NEIEG|nr:hypothetical protein NEIELOOT_00958 [Neisseria elongata subsp. glycolytica ATCC 29315]
MWKCSSSNHSDTQRIEFQRPSESICFQTAFLSDGLLCRQRAEYIVD